MNHGLGEYEETIARAWHRTSSVRGLFLKQACPSIIKECEPMFQTLVRPQTRGILATEEDDTFNLISFHMTEVNGDDDNPSFKGKLALLPEGYGLAFQSAKPYHKIPSKAVIKAHVHHLGLSYTSYEKHKGNSFVFLRNIAAPFMIENILEFPPGRDNQTLQGTWIVGHHLKPSTSFSIDLYSKYRELGASIWSTELDPQLRAVKITEIEAHGARLKWQDSWVVISLRRVCVFSGLIIYTLIHFDLVSFW